MTAAFPAPEALAARSSDARAKAAAEARDALAARPPILLKPLPEGPKCLPHHRYARHPWAPMTDAEWDLLGPLVTHRLAATPARGRPAQDPRRSWDAIFWVACSAGPWKDLPDHLGKPDTAHRTLRRALRSGLLDRLLLGISDDPRVRRILAPLGWRIARAWRRVTRLLDMGRLLLARRLGLLDAAPCHPDLLPRPHLSETIVERAKMLFRNWEPALARHLFGLHRLHVGDPRAWTLTD